MRVLEARVKKKSAKFMILCSRYLFKAIDGLLKFADIGWMILIYKTWWLLHVDGFREVDLKKGVVDIKLA